ncbi:MAG: CopD family protein [Candidatus Binatia bacterium]
MLDWHAFTLLLHLVALTLWLGGVGFFLAAFRPAVNDLKPGAAMRALNQGRVAFEGVAWIGIALLMVTGIVVLILHSQDTGDHLGQTYMIILAIKLFLFVAMLVHHTLQVFKYGPRIAALTNEVSSDTAAWPEALREHWRKWFMLLKLNAALGLVVILLGVLLMES